MDSDLKEKIKKLHLKYVPSPFKDDFFDLVWTHAQIVGKIAQQLADNWETKTGNNLNREMVELGALVHDIGVYQCDFEDFGVGGKKASYICHGVLGRDLLLKEGYPIEIARFASCHVGVGLTAEDVVSQRLPIPQDDYVPVSPEEEIVCFADKFHTKHPRFSSFEEELQKISQYGQAKTEKLESFKEKYGIPDLGVLEKEYGEWHKKFDGFFKRLQILFLLFFKSISLKL